VIDISEMPQVEVLKYPHPYQGAFTISSDIDSANVARFRAIHALFCQRDSISEGSSEWQRLGLTEKSPGFDRNRRSIPGFGFQFGDSFFLVGDKTTIGMYRHVPEEDAFDEDQQDGENCAALIRRWIKEGQIDSFHAFLHYTRRQIEPLLTGFYQWCEQESVPKPRVWINHSTAVTPSGICPNRLQPFRAYSLARLAARKVVGPLLGRRRIPLRNALVRYDGDTPGSQHYVNDLLAANGLRYVWLNRNDIHINSIALPETLQGGRSTILLPITMDDGVRYWRFERCAGRPESMFDGCYFRNSDEGYDSSCLITENNLNELCRRCGTCVLTTHWTHYRSLPLSDETIARFHMLKRWQDEGKIWVTSAERLLEWTRRRTFLEIACHRERGQSIVDILGVNDPIFGREPVKLKDLHRLALRVKSQDDAVKIALRGRVLNPEEVQRSGSVFWLQAEGAARSMLNVSW
jgi:hypothetical protein